MTKLTEAKRDAIRDDLLDAIIDDDQTSSRKIARRRRVTVGSVAAVKANLTRGTYGDPKNLIRKRRRVRNANS